MKHVTIALFTPSAIIKNGLKIIVSSLADTHATFIDLFETDIAREVSIKKPSIIITDALTLGKETIDAVREAGNKGMKILAVSTCALPQSVSNYYDAVISIYDRPEVVREIIKQHLWSETIAVKELTPREKEIVVGIVKGLSNKEIAQSINVSVNTVMTHRRNIASKLQIHSVAGLTIYAIVSKLVKLEDVKQSPDFVNAPPKNRRYKVFRCAYDVS